MKKFQKTETNRLNCPIQLTANLLGERWVLLIVRELFLGNSKFSEFQDNLKISKSVLTSKLKMLENAGLIAKKEYQENNKRARNEYFLTEKGGDLIKIMSAILIWGNSNLVDKNEPFLKIVDKSGAPVKMTIVNEEGNSLNLNDLQFILS
ncbi:MULTISPECIES: helix-turn-helix domain-containing protein [unclassified Aureispira]|uniref:winged helix-turn-helix transcriptional regulator n=1 Tax=unclassified Aureispira TaxID=2649989 RepID=UPI000699215E|nr:MULTISPECIES: helix-turn-helix domain-containing protein [unclassified Aureispira]WMX13119.1 helix-turn-helix domain-containing protein [Aureispira sp. CCB-E]